MHIALLSDKFPPDPGGLAVSAARLAHLLAAAGHRVQVFAPGAQPPAATAADGVIIHRIAPRKRTDEILSNWFDAVVAAHRADPFDLLHAYFVATAGYVAAFAGRYLGVPSVVSARGNDVDRAAFDPSRAAHLLYALNHASAVTTNAAELARKAEALAPGLTVTLIPNGVDAAQFTPAPRDDALAASLGVAGLPVVGFVGEARAKKGLTHLLLAFRAVAARRPAALLLVGGARDGDDRDVLKVFQKQNPALVARVVPYMTPDALPAYYNLLDVLALPSLHDGLPNALLEGMACGCAVVGARVGGIPDALSDGENGRLVPPGDVDALAAAIDALLDSDAERARLGFAARATILQRYAPANELEANLRIYKRLATSH
ncbi:MAG: glycosyltransferase [Chloroflexi bacterium]|nr:glycosyltransferase [Chloroflexota bacterium]